jgi:hypothetical protein
MIQTKVNQSIFAIGNLHFQLEVKEIKEVIEVIEGFVSDDFEVHQLNVN